VRILYGGSVKPAKARGILALPEVGGALVGGRKPKGWDFEAIFRAVSAKARLRGSARSPAPACRSWDRKERKSYAGCRQFGGREEKAAAKKGRCLMTATHSDALVRSHP